MRFFFLATISCFFLSQAYSEITPPQPDKFKFECQLSEGFRKDSLTWSVRGEHGHPNILSELHFKDIKIAQTHLQTKLNSKFGFIRVDLAYGNLYSGKISDSDYMKNNRKFEYSRSVNTHITGKYTFDAAVAFGKDFTLPKHWTCSPLVGYGYNVASYKFKKGIRTRELSYIGDIIKTHHHIHGLNSTYRNTWNAPFVGCRVVNNPLKKLKLFGEYNFIFALKYNAKLYWNLRDKHGKFSSKRSSGFGHSFQTGADYEIFDKFHLIGEFLYKFMEAKNGSAKSKEHHIKIPTTKFRKATLRSSEVRLTLQYDF